jgi:hypothetical protein
MSMFFNAAARGNGDFVKHLAEWLRHGGFENVREEHFHVDLGARCKNADWCKRGSKVMLSTAMAMLGGASHKYSLDIVTYKGRG